MRPTKQRIVLVAVALQAAGWILVAGLQSSLSITVPCFLFGIPVSHDLAMNILGLSLFSIFGSGLALAWFSISVAARFLRHRRWSLRLKDLLLAHALVSFVVMLGWYVVATSVGAAFPYSPAPGEVLIAPLAILLRMVPTLLEEAPLPPLVLYIYMVLVFGDYWWMGSEARFERRSARRAAEGLCWKCGYSLVGNVSGVCPECGSVTR